MATLMCAVFPQLVKCSGQDNVTNSDITTTNVSQTAFSNQSLQDAIMTSTTTATTTEITTLSQPPDMTDTARELLKLLEKILDMVVFVLGTFGNIMTVVTLCFMRAWDSPLHVFLVALAVSDQLVLVNGLFFVWLGKVSGWYPWHVHIVPCKLMLWMLETTAKLSSWFLVSLTFQRMLAVIWPHRVHVFCTRGRSLMLVCAQTLFFMLMHVQYLDSLYLDEIRGRDTFICRYNRADLAYMKYLDLIFFTLLPFIIVLLSNGVIAWRLAASVRTARHSLASSSHSPQKRQINDRKKRASSTTATVLTLSVAFLIFTLPICVYNSLQFWNASVTGFEGEVFIYVASLLAYCNNVVNFYLYCLTGTKFRQQFASLMCCLRN